MTNITEQPKAAREFAKRWDGKGYEKGESQLFWIELLSEIFDVANPSQFIYFEQQVKLDHTAFIDAFIPTTHVMIEQKSLDKRLDAPIKQSDGTFLTPFQQAKRYASELPYSQRPRWIVTCNFCEFWIYDMEKPNGEPQKIALVNLGKEYYRLHFLVDEGDEHLRREMEVSVQAGELVGKMYDLLLDQYGSRKRMAESPTGYESVSPSKTTGDADGSSAHATLDTSESPVSHDSPAPTNGDQFNFPTPKNRDQVDSPAPSGRGQGGGADILHSLNILCVRIVFCLYAEDADIFPSRTAFHDYLKPYRSVDIRMALQRLFDVLDTPYAERDPYLEDNLRIFPYVNGGLFDKKTRSNVIPPFNEALRNLLLLDMSSYFDWSQISPTIFGAVFESTLNPVTRRSGGMHYTSIENIHKVIDPLFLDELRTEFENIVEGNNRRQHLADFQNKLASLIFFDPACGSGNFLTETYLSLRRLENAVIETLYGDNLPKSRYGDVVKVSISQFYGIEINDFAVSVAKTALWIAENQMLRATSEIVGEDLSLLPLKTNAYIHEGNALCMDWTALFTHQPSSLMYQPILADQPHFPNYIFGNPPFVGARIMSQEQKNDLSLVFGKTWKNFGNLDYVAGWYRKAAEWMAENPSIKSAFVSTSSITQGEQVAILWKPLMEQYGLHIDFAYRTFRWDSESDIKAHVHCVIMGFSVHPTAVAKPKRIYLSDNQIIEAKHINPYLIDAPDVWIESRTKPLCDVPEIGIGNKPIDGGNYLFTGREKEEFIIKEPKSGKFFRPWYGAEEFINNKKRYCLWLGECSPTELKTMPYCYERVKNVREYRLQSSSAGTRKLADKPTRFHVENMPKDNYLIIPRVSSERRRYIPIGFMDSEMLCGDSVHIIPNASLYHFGVLTSNVHMAWMRAICGRLEIDYRYSKNIVYNNFPWPKNTKNPNDLKDFNPLKPLSPLTSSILQTAQAILDARTKYPDSSLADLYDEVTMPPELRKAHQDNDRAVMQAYGFSPKMTESECVTELFKMYEELSTYLSSKELSANLG